MTALAPVVLHGRHVRLEPLSLAHVPRLVAIGLDPTLWQWIPHPVRDEAGMHAYVAAALDEQKRGVSLPFAIVDAGDGTVAGSTRYGNIDLANKRVEIGWTWLGQRFQRTPMNTEAKLLLLRHAFDTLGLHRVELKTDALNMQSRTAILRIGAIEEGTFRKHVLTASGRWRDSVYFSILDTEWPAVKTRLTSKLGD